MTVAHNSDAQCLGERFDPFRDPYLANPYEFFAEARRSTPVFYSPRIDYWVVTRYHDVREIFASPQLFSASNALSPIRPPCADAARILIAGGFAPIPTLTNVTPPAHTRVRRLANAAFKPKRVAAMEPFVRELVVRFAAKQMVNRRADLIRDFAWELPALVIFRVLGIPDEDVPQVKAGAESRILFMFGQSTPEEQCRLARAMAAFWGYAEKLVAARAHEPQEDFTSDLLMAREGDLPALTHTEAATIVYGLLLAGHETTTNLLGNAFH